MVWNSCAPGSFGLCPIECLEQVVADPGALLQERFRRVLAAVRELLRSTGSMEKAHKAAAVYRSLLAETESGKDKE